MTLLSRQRVALLLVLAVTTALYLYGLDRAPVYVGGDEAHFAAIIAAIGLHHLLSLLKRLR